MNEPLKPDPSPSAPPQEIRLYSLDVFRGLTMIWMISEGFGLHVFSHDPLLGPLAVQFTHRDWQGMNAWDLIQPFFMFIVGVAMPFSFEKRWAAGEPWKRSLRHVLRRCALLILFGLVARSIQAGRPVLDLINVLAQVSFTYLVAFLLLRSRWTFQVAVAFAMLALHWAIHQFSGLPQPWAKNANVGWLLDQYILGKNWSGGYATINCISSAFNTVFGVIAGRVLMDPSASRRTKILAGTGIAFILAGLAIDPVIPIIKKIWTASFAIYSAGFCLLALLLFHWICDLRGWQKWGRIPAIVGANSIFIYLFHEILHSWLDKTALVFTGWTIRGWGPWGHVFTACTVIAFQIYVCWWLYQRRIFFKL